MILNVTLFAFVSSFLLGVLVSVAPLLWQRILFGLWVAGCTLGLLTLVDHLVRML